MSSSRSSRRGVRGQPAGQPISAAEHDHRGIPRAADRARDRAHRSSMTELGQPADGSRTGGDCAGWTEPADVSAVLNGDGCPATNCRPTPAVSLRPDPDCHPRTGGRRSRVPFRRSAGLDSTLGTRRRQHPSHRVRRHRRASGRRQPHPAAGLGGHPGTVVPIPAGRGRRAVFLDLVSRTGERAPEFVPWMRAKPHKVLELRPSGICWWAPCCGSTGSTISRRNICASWMCPASTRSSSSGIAGSSARCWICASRRRGSTRPPRRPTS